jgi:hypothetical protein
MANRYKVTLTQSERTELTQLTRCGKTPAAKFLHARALLLCDAGEHGDPWKVADVAAALGISSRTVEHIKQSFVEEGLEAALVRKPPCKPWSGWVFAHTKRTATSVWLERSICLLENIPLQ